MGMKPISQIESRLGIESNGKAHQFFTNECRRYMDKYVPFETGQLRDNVSEEVDSITYESRYAHYQYIGISNSGKPLHYNTPLTGSYWDKKMWTAEGTNVVDSVQNYVNRGCK